MSGDAAPAAAEVSRRLALAASLTSLGADARLDAKLDMSASGVTRRLREVADLLALCRRLDATRPHERPSAGS